MGIFVNSPTTPTVLSPVKKSYLTSAQVSPKGNHTSAFTVVKTIRANVYLIRFSIFMYILFIHVNTDTFLSLTCTYTLALRAYRGGECTTHPSEQFFITLEQLEVLRANFNSVD